MEEICVRCGGRSPRRFCPVLREPICSKCCGKSRNKTIRCVEECQHLAEARTQALKRLVNLAGDNRFEVKFFEVLHNLRMTVVKIRARANFNLSEDEVLEAIDNVLRTQRALSRGVIYEFRSPNVNTQMVMEGLMLVVRWHKDGEKGLRRLEPEEITTCLEYLQRQGQVAKEKGVKFLELWANSVGGKLLGS
ncbi:MAG: hypothetical protein ABIK39_01105 [candidate division WOR-3 bacterium]